MEQQNSFGHPEINGSLLTHVLKLQRCTESWARLVEDLTLCMQSAHLYAYVIYLAYVRCTYICMGGGHSSKA